MTFNKTKRSCDQMGVCQGLGADECPNCTAWECEVAVPEPKHRVVVPCPAYRFAPGVIEGPKNPATYADKGPWLPLSLGDTFKLFGLILVLGTVAGFMVERYL